MPLSLPSQKRTRCYSGSGNLFVVIPYILSRDAIRTLCDLHSLDGVISYHHAPDIYLSFGLSSSESEAFTPQILGCSADANGQEPFAKQKSTRDASKVLEYEEEKPKTQVMYAMRIFNRDGSEAAMCGNGLRCLIAHLWESGIRQTLYTISTLAGTYTGSYERGQVTISSPPPSPIQQRFIDGICFYCLNTGVPHAVCLEEISDFRAFGRHFVHHPAFGPEGSNITGCCLVPDRKNFHAFDSDFSGQQSAELDGNLTQVVENERKVGLEKVGQVHENFYDQVLGTHLSTRTFERGVEEITGACGTGCLAAACVIAHLSPHPPSLTLHVPSGETLTVTFSPLTLTGAVHSNPLQAQQVSL